jgi:hypothetical protein
MPADYILRTSDMLKITISPPAVVPSLIPPIPLMGSSANFSVMGMPISTYAVYQSSLCYSGRRYS